MPDNIIDRFKKATEESDGLDVNNLLVQDDTFARVLNLSEEGDK